MRNCFAIAALMIGVVPVAAQPTAPAVDDRWTAWLGCWQQVTDAVRTEDEADDPAPRDVPTRGIVVCVTPASNPATVTMNTIVEKQSAFQETIVADGGSHTIDEPGCTGSQRATWSTNGRRLFAHATLTCSDGSKRTIDGLTTIAPGPTWVDVQVVNREGRESVRVRRYRRAPDHAYANLSAEQLARAASAAARQAVPFTMEEVSEATERVSPSTVEAALVETRASFPLNAKRLQELDEAGVPDRVLDLMIALSFPNKFIVERRTPSAQSSSFGTSGFDTFGWYDMTYDLFPYHYAPFGYGMWGRSDYYYYGAPIYAVGDVSPPEIQPSGQGRVVDGLGYTRVRQRAPEPTAVANGGGVGGEGVSAGGSSSGGGVSGQGYSGGGGGDSGRTAVARPPQ
jgi:hypothetical protein